jgi:phosphonate transport system substrate-binding protein
MTRLRITLLGCMALGAMPAQQTTAGRDANMAAQGQRHVLLRTIASSKVFNNVNRNDARAALKVWFDVLAKQNGYVLDSAVDIVDSVAEIRERLQSHSVELITMGTLDFVDLESSNLVVPMLTDARTAQGSELYSYVLLVNPASLATSIAGLRGKNVLVSARGTGQTGLAWLDVLLAKEKLGRAASFFASVKLAAKPQACILPLFFGTVDACVADEIDLNLAREMNPQLAQLRVIARSRPMIESVIAVPADPHPYQKELIDSMLSLDKDPRGRQLLMVFKTERMVHIQPGDLDPARELWRDYFRLSGPALFRPPDRGKDGH